MIARAAAVVLALGAGAAAILWGGPALLEAWLLGFLLWAGLALGALAVLMLGQLQGSEWLPALRPELAAGARSLPLAALLAIPVLWMPEALYPWASPGVAAALPEARSAFLQVPGFRLRGVLILALWIALALLVTRRGPDRPRLAGLGLLLLLPSAGLAAQDWAMSRDPAWYGSLQGLAFLVEQAAAALALAILLRQRRADAGRPAPEERAGLERALLTLMVATLWLWFVQFTVVWMADLPEEAAWYLRRSGPGWVELKFLVVLPGLLGGIALGIVPRWGRGRAAGVALLVVVQHVAHLAWLLRPDAPLASPPLWLDAAVVPLLGLAMALWWRAERRRAAVATADQPGAGAAERGRRSTSGSGTGRGVTGTAPARPRAPRV